MVGGEGGWREGGGGGEEGEGWDWDLWLKEKKRFFKKIEREREERRREGVKEMKGRSEEQHRKIFMKPNLFTSQIKQQDQQQRTKRKRKKKKEKESK